MTAAREEILARIRRATGKGSAAAPAPVAVPRDYRRTGDHAPGSPAVLDLLADRLVDYRATVRRCSAAQVPAAVRDALAAALPAGGAVLVPPGLPDGWAPDGVPDAGTASATELAEYAAVVTAATAAAAETGTIVLDGSPDQGRRAISLVPDVHVCVVRADQVVHTVPELLARLSPERPLTFVSGPSATSDIELERVEGVHGPRTLVVVLVSE
jgi:L-lactate dehydrogenase complex protein LldG